MIAGPSLPDDIDFKAVFQNLTEGLVLCDPTGRVVHWNRVALALHQVGDPAEVHRPLDQLLATFRLERVDGGPVPFDEWPMVRALRGEFVRDLKLRIVRSDREWSRVFSYSTSTAPGREGTPPLIVLHVSDVTAFHEAERANAESLLARQALVDVLRLLLSAPQLQREVMGQVFELLAQRLGFVVCAFERNGVVWARGAPEQIPLQLPAGLVAFEPQLLDRRGRRLATLCFGLRAPPTSIQRYLSEALATQLGTIMEREGVEAELAAARAQFSSLSESLQQLVWMASTEGRTDYLASRWESYTGVSIPRLLADGWASVVHPDDLPAARGLWQAKRSSGGPLHTEFRIKRHDGVYRWFSIDAVPLRGASGAVERWFGLNTETEELRETQRSLRDREQRLQLVFDQMSAILWTIDRDFSITSVGGRALATLGVKANELLGRRITEVSPPATERDFSFLERLTRSMEGEVQRYDTRVRENYFHTTLAPLREPDGSIVGVIGLAIDVSEQRRAQVALERLNLELETRVADATAELRAANAELEAFAYAVSHDLRAPLRAMSGFSEAIIEDLGPNAPVNLASSAQRIVKASRTMGELIDALLKLSRVTRGDLQNEVVDVSALSGTLVAGLAAAWPEREVVCHLQPGLQVRADRAMVGVLLQNLLENAWKYTGKTAAPQVWVEAITRQGQRYVCVRDNGAGFDMAYAARLFAPFQRLHRQDEFPGLGVGLATVQRIAHRHGGKVFAEGVPGKGATIGFWLPDDVSSSGERT